MGSEFNEVYHHRLRYFLTPQFDMYRNIRQQLLDQQPEWAIDEHLSVLDYGCGNGVGSVMLKNTGWDVVGIDSDEEAVAFAADSWGHLAEFKCEDWCAYGDFTEKSRITRKFDVLVCLEVIEHVFHPKVLLERFRMMCSAGARVFISTLNHNSQYRKNRGHVGKFCVSDFRFICSQAFPGVRIFNYDLSEELGDESALTPMVAVWEGDNE